MCLGPSSIYSPSASCHEHVTVSTPFLCTTEQCTYQMQPHLKNKRSAGICTLRFDTYLHVTSWHGGLMSKSDVVLLGHYVIAFLSAIQKASYHEICVKL
jgi:hypothetical protein